MPLPLVPLLGAGVLAAIAYAVSQGHKASPVIPPANGNGPGSPVFDSTLPVGLPQALTKLIQSVGGESADYLTVSSALFNQQGYPVTSQSLLAVANYLRASLNPLVNGTLSPLSWPPDASEANSLVLAVVSVTGGTTGVPNQVQWTLSADGSTFVRDGALPLAIAQSMLGYQPGGITNPPVITPPGPSTGLPTVSPIPPASNNPPGPPTIAAPPPATGLPNVTPIPPPPGVVPTTLISQPPVGPNLPSPPVAPPPIATPPAQIDPVLALAQAAAANPSDSNAVMMFQGAYNNAGGSPALTVDGKYGPMTAAALNKYTSAPAPLGAYSGGGGGGGGSGVTPGGASTPGSTDGTTASTAFGNNPLGNGAATPAGGGGDAYATG